MPRVTRGYQHKDFSYLLTKPEIHNNECTAVITIEEPKITNNISDEEKLRRRRSSLLDNRKLKYVIDKRLGYLHDKSCKKVKSIDDQYFDMTEELVPDMALCKTCCRAAWIRSGIGDDAKRMSAYIRFFQKCKVSNPTLKKLMLDYNAQLHIEDINTMSVKINEDTWQIHIDSEGSLQLYHNNYIVARDGSRIFTQGFHDQKLHGEKTFACLIKYAHEYSWEKHLDYQKAKTAAETVENISVEKPVEHPTKQLSIAERFVNCVYSVFHKLLKR